MPFFTVEGPRLIPAAGGGDFATGLLYFWPLDDPNIVSTTIKDTKDSQDGTISGTISSGTGPNASTGLGLTTCRLSDGTAGNFTNFTAATLMDWNANDWSIAGWLWIDDNTALSSDAVNPQYYFTDSRNSTNTNQILIRNSGVLAGKIVVDTGSVMANNIATSASVLPSATFKHIGITKTGSNSPPNAIFVNGASVTVVTAASGNGFSDTFSGFFAGTSAGTAGCLKGRLSSWRIYNRALSAADMAALYAAGG